MSKLDQVEKENENFLLKDIWDILLPVIAKIKNS